MALRIGGGLPQMEAASQPALLPEEAPMEPMAEEAPVEEPTLGIESKVSQEVARYFGPEYRCAGCVRFMEGSDSVGECMVVDGPIAPDGVCSLFEPDTDALSAGEPMETLPDASNEEME